MDRRLRILKKKNALGGSTIRAILWTRYGDAEGLLPGELPVPVPNSGELLIHVKAAGVTAGDSEMRRMELPLSLSFPMRLFVSTVRPKRIRVLGQEFAGVVEAVGDGVTSWSPGDRVFGTTGIRFGAYAEYFIAKERPGDAEGCLAAIPPELSFAEAAVLPTAGMEALHFIREAGLSAGDEVLIVGAGGSIGGYSLQMAKKAGARVVVVDRTGKLDMLRSLGADECIDFTAADMPLDTGRFRAIIDVVGAGESRAFIRGLETGGRYFVANPRLRHIAAGWGARRRGKRLVIRPADQSAAELEDLAALAAKGHLRIPLDRTFPMNRAAEAHRYVDAGGKKGNVALVMD